LTNCDWGDTNSLYTPDAFICAWHPNLGRPHTFYSDSTRTWGSATSDRAIDKAAYNSTPEHFETVHYHAVNYAASLGPFNLNFKTPKPPSNLSGTFSSVTGSPSVITFSADISSDGVTGGDYLFVQNKILGKVAAGGVSRLIFYLHRHPVLQSTLVQMERLKHHRIFMLWLVMRHKVVQV
jgi:hypothetical protein